MPLLALSKMFENHFATGVNKSTMICHAPEIVVVILSQVSDRYVLMPSQSVTKKVFMSSHADSQSPLKTSVRKLIKLDSAPSSVSIRLPADPTKLLKDSPASAKSSPITGPNVSINH